MLVPHPAPMSGRRAQAARNDARILAAAREVFVDNPDAPISAVAERAGVGMSALYRRYSGKEELLQTLCLDGLRRYNAAAETALLDRGDAWESFAQFLHKIVEEDTHSLTLRLAGTFGPTDELAAESARASTLVGQLFDRTKAAGVVRDDLVVDDLGFIFEMVASVRRGERSRTARLRERFLTLVVDALRPPSSTLLPGPPPTFAELTERFRIGGGTG